MRNCFVPGCDKLCRTKGTVKRKMFVVPKDKVLFDAWLNVLPKTRELKAHDKVCERHFAENDISTTYNNIINGQLFKMERGRAKLMPNAIPCRNFECAESSKRLKISTVHYPMKELEVIEMKQETQKTCNTTSLEEQQLEIDGEVQEITEICHKNNSDPTESIVAYEITSEENQDDEVSSEVRELFESFYDDIYEVVLPNTLWGVHRCPEQSSIFFSFVDPNMMRTTKLVSISCQGRVKVSLGNRLVNEQNIVSDIANIEALAALIAEVDEVLLCSKIFDNEFCEVSLKNVDSEVCEACSHVL